MLESPSLRDMVTQLFRTARKRDACVWGLSQAVEDFTGRRISQVRLAELFLPPRLFVSLDVKEQHGCAERVPASLTPQRLKRSSLSVRLKKESRVNSLFVLESVQRQLTVSTCNSPHSNTGLPRRFRARTVTVCGGCKIVRTSTMR